LLPGAAPGKRRAVPALQGAGRCHAGGHLSGAAGHLQVLQHGPGGRSGTGPVPAHRPGRGCHPRSRDGIGRREASVSQRIFSSFLMAGYECSSHRRNDGRRLDLLDSTGHARFAAQDYRQLAPLGISSIRDGLRWHLIERRPGHYDWSGFLPMLHAARECGLQVIWDLCHYGYPDDLDIWRPEFVARFERFAAAVAQLMKDEGIDTPFYSPINEISFWSWAGGAEAYFNPCARHRGAELKHQLVRASIAAIEAIRAVTPQARFVQCDPLINVISRTHRADEVEAAE